MNITTSIDLCILLQFHSSIINKFRSNPSLHARNFWTMTGHAGSSYQLIVQIAATGSSVFPTRQSVTHTSAWIGRRRFIHYRESRHRPVCCQIHILLTLSHLLHYIIPDKPPERARRPKSEHKSQQQFSKSASLTNPWIHLTF